MFSEHKEVSELQRLKYKRGTIVDQRFASPSCHQQNSCVEAPTLSVTVFEDRTFTEGTK